MPLTYDVKAAHCSRALKERGKRRLDHDVEIAVDREIGAAENPGLEDRQLRPAARPPAFGWQADVRNRPGFYTRCEARWIVSETGETERDVEVAPDRVVQDSDASSGERRPPL